MYVRRRLLAPVLMLGITLPAQSQVNVRNDHERATGESGATAGGENCNCHTSAAGGPVCVWPTCWEPCDIGNSCPTGLVCVIESCCGNGEPYCFLECSPSSTCAEGVTCGEPETLCEFTPTATITLQPVPPKTVPPSNYPAGSFIDGQTLTLGSVPARVWIEVHVTGWTVPPICQGPGAPGFALRSGDATGPGFALRSGDVTAQARVDATDLDGDGGGYDGDQSVCADAPAPGAGDLLPAVVSCEAGTCQGNAAVPCRFTQDCTDAGTSGPCNISRVCDGNHNISCQATSDCTAAGTSGPCIAQGDLACRAALSGVTSTCGLSEASKCLPSRPNYLPPGGPVCEFAFIDRCHPRYVGSGISLISAMDLATINTRFGFTADPGEVTPDFAPSYFGTLVLDVPSNARGTYVVDLKDDETYMQNCTAASIPLAARNPAIINFPCGACCVDITTPSFSCQEAATSEECEALPGSTHHFMPGLGCDSCCTCLENDECNDSNSCTSDICACDCYNIPLASWNPATECCDPTSGVQSLIPALTPCRVGGCSDGGSSGTPMFTELADGTACVPEDPCNLAGECEAGVCRGEQYAGSNCAKSRFISFDIGTGSVPSAYRVRLVSLHHPDPPYSGGLATDFSSLEGQYRWVGAPQTYAESGTDPTPVHAALTSCQPHYQDWAAIDLLHVGGSEIVPSSIYEVQWIAEGLDIEDEDNYSAPLTIVTGRWADVVNPYNPPSATVQPDQTDVTAMVQKFRNLPFVISKPRAMMRRSGVEDVPDLSFDVGFTQISTIVDAFRGVPYPFVAPPPCP